MAHPKKPTHPGWRVRSPTGNGTNRRRRLKDKIFISGGIFITVEDNRLMESEHLIQLHQCEVPRIKNYKQVLRFVEKFLVENGPSTTLEIWKELSEEYDIMIKDFDEVSLAMAIGKSGLFRNENLKTNEHNLWTLPI